MGQWHFPMNLKEVKNALGNKPFQSHCGNYSTMLVCHSAFGAHSVKKCVHKINCLSLMGLKWKISNLILWNHVNSTQMSVLVLEDSTKRKWCVTLPHCHNESFVRNLPTICKGQNKCKKSIPKPWNTFKRREVQISHGATQLHNHHFLLSPLVHVGIFFISSSDRASFFFDVMHSSQLQMESAKKMFSFNL